MSGWRQDGREPYELPAAALLAAPDFLNLVAMSRRPTRQSSRIEDQSLITTTPSEPKPPDPLPGLAASAAYPVTEPTFRGRDQVSRRSAPRSMAPPRWNAGRASFRTGNPGLMTRVGSMALPFSTALLLLIAARLATGQVGPDYIILATLAFFILYPATWSREIDEIDFGMQVLTPWLGTLAVLGVLGLVTGHLWHFPVEVIVVWAALTPLVHFLVLQFLPPLLALLVRVRRRPHRVAIVGHNDLAISFARQLESDPTAHCTVLGHFDDREEPGRADAGFRHLGRLGEIADFVKVHGVDQIYIALPLSSQSPRILNTLDALRDSTASVFFLPDVTGIDLIQPRMDTQSGFPVIGLCESPFKGANGTVKRAIDLLVAGTAVTLLMPVMILIALLIKLTSPGPVLFRQKRFGLDGSSIVVWKFRSMRVTEDGEKAYKQVTRGDPRVTRLGAFLRKTSLDELPQLFNVLRGEMSVVGPRPHVVSVNEQYRTLISGYMLRHKVPPGITGWAQVNGYRGGDDLPSMTKRIEYDLDYLRHWSVWMDVRILARTVLLVFRDSKAY